MPNALELPSPGEVQQFPVLLVKVPFGDLHTTQNLLEFHRNVHLLLPQTSVIIMLKATKGHQNPQIEAGCCPGACLQPGWASPVLPLPEMVSKPASVLSWLYLVLSGAHESLPSALPQRPPLQNFLFLFIPVLQLVPICLVSVVPHPGERLCGALTAAASSGTSPGLCALPSLLRDFPKKSGHCGLC